MSFDSKRYSVPFTLIGQTVEVERCGDDVRFYHRGEPIATHRVLPARPPVAILPEHGPGAIARNARQRRSAGASTGCPPPDGAVEIRDLALYEPLAAVEVTP